MNKNLFIAIALFLPLAVFAQTAEECYKIGEEYYYGKNGKKVDYAESLKWFRKAAKQGNIGAQYNLGVMYTEGQGVTKDLTKAVKWFHKAAEQGHSSAQNNLGAFYNNGIGVAQDYTESVKWYQKAAEQGHAVAQYNLGIMYSKGQGVSLDFTEAIKWYRKAAEQGLASAQNNLGNRYKYGQGVAQDYEEAVRWYRKAAEQGHAVAQYNLGVMYSEGKGIAQNYTEAMNWYLKAAEQDNVYAMTNIGMLYEKGYGVSQNYQTAKEWYQKAVNINPNYSDAKFSLAWIEELIVKQDMTIVQDDDNQQQNENEKTEVTVESDNTPNTFTTTIDMPDVDKNIPHATTKNPNLLAVIIGNEKYTKLPNVPYAENDAKMFKEYCEKTLGAKEKNIRYLPNAGYVDIRGAVNWLKEGANSYSGEARVIFYYAGHGLPDPNTGSQYLLPADVDGKYLDLTVSLQKLYDDLGQMPARSVTVFLDACFSGTNRDKKMIAANSGARLAFAKSKIGTPTGKTVIFSATEEDQTAHPFKDRKHGFFTYFLLRKLQESKGEATLGEIADYVTVKVKRAVFDEIETSQTPSVKPSGNFANDWRNIKLK